MAWYDRYEVRYKGRLMEVNTRYGILDGAGGVHVIKGKPLSLKCRDIRRIWLILLKQNKRARLRIRPYDDASYLP